MSWMSTILNTKIRQMKKEKQVFIPIVKIMEWWKKGHTSEGVKGGSFNLELYLNYCIAREIYEGKRNRN